MPSPSQQVESAELPDWVGLLQEAADRNGTVELHPAGPQRRDVSTGPMVRQPDGSYADPASGSGRQVRVLAVNDEESIVVERPWSAAQAESVQVGQPMLVVVGRHSQRCSFRTTVRQQLRYPLNEHTSVIALRLGWPQRVHRAQRRDYFRVETAAAPLPPVELWTLEDAASAVPFEQYNRKIHCDRGNAGHNPPPKPRPPQLGENFRGVVLDLSGGGVCVALPAALEPKLRELPLLWLKIQLPELEEPLYTTARIAHWHTDDERRLRVGLSFSFEHHPDHERFVSDRMCRAAVRLQRLQLKRSK